MQKMQAAGEMAGAGGANVSGGLNMGMQTFGTQADINQQNNMWNQQKEWMLGQNTGASFGRTRPQEFALRNLQQPQMNTNVNYNYRIPFQGQTNW
jgi:hypothetical protein